MGGAKHDEAPVGHTTTSPCHCKENTWRYHHRQVHLAVAVKATARQLNRPCDSLAIPPKHEKNENQDLWVSAFRNVNCNAMYLFWESPCHYLTFIWDFKMLIKCNANVSIPGAMRNANVMQMNCNANKCKKNA